MPPHDTPRPAAPPHRPRRWAARAAALLALGLLALPGALWWWAGTPGSLATLLAWAARALPAGQTLQAQGVDGTLRAGGRIAALHWSSPTLDLQVQDAELRWQPGALLQGRLQFDTLQAARLTLTPQDAPPTADTPPPTPPQQLTLPLPVELPLRVQQLVWAGARPLELSGLAAHYRYDGSQHHLDIATLDFAQGRYALQATLQAHAPLALQARVQGRVEATVPGTGQARPWEAEAQAQGTLAGAGAQVAVQARVRSAAQAAVPVHADLQARIAPWAAQPRLRPRCRPWTWPRSGPRRPPRNWTAAPGWSPRTAAAGTSRPTCATPAPAPGTASACPWPHCRPKRACRTAPGPWSTPTCAPAAAAPRPRAATRPRARRCRARCRCAASTRRSGTASSRPPR